MHPSKSPIMGKRYCYVDSPNAYMAVVFDVKLLGGYTRHRKIFWAPLHAFGSICEGMAVGKMSLNGGKVGDRLSIVTGQRETLESSADLRHRTAPMEKGSR